MSFRFILLVIAILLILVVIFYIIRSQKLYHASMKLYDHADTFPTDYYVGTKTDPEILYVALGDSITTGTGVKELTETLPYLIAQSLATKGHYVHVINKAKSGARIEDLIQDQLPELTELKADYISITVGSNDATHFTPLETYQESLTTVIKKLEELESTVLFSNATHIGSAPALPPIYARSVINRAAKQNELLENIVSTTTENIRVVDLYGKGRLTHRLYATDLFHPNKEGYVFWAELFKEKL